MDMNKLCCNSPSAAMLGNKPRLYIGLYVRGGPSKMPGKEDTYHWALLTGPKRDPRSGYKHIMYHAKERLVVEGDPKAAKRIWEYAVECDRASMLLVRIVVAKVSDLGRLEKTLQRVPLRPEKEGWNCVSWVQEALHHAVIEPGTLGSHVQDWEAIRDKAMWYVEQKKVNHRFDGLVQFDTSRPATWDMLRDQELIM